MDSTLTALAPIPENIPDELKTERRWVCWKIVLRHGKPTKLPIDAKTGSAASSTDATTWGDFNQAVETYQKQKLDGIGFVLGDSWCGVDLDDCIAADGGLTSLAHYVVSSLASYTERSPSGAGLHVIMKATLPKGLVASDGKTEIYPSGRFFCMTGHTLPDSALQVEKRQAELDRLVRELFPPKQTRRNQAAINDPSGVVERAQRYLAAIPATVCGTHSCERKTIGVSCVLICGFGLSCDAALPLFRQWADRGSHDWSDDDLLRKLAASQDYPGERGWLLPKQTSGNATTVIRRPVEIPDDDDLPDADDADSPDSTDLPPDCAEPPGFLGELIGHNLRTSLYPQPQFALAGALALLATLTGRKITDQFGSRPNCYILSLGPSGCGKERARKLNAEVLLNSGQQHMLGAGSFASHAGLIAHVAQQPTQLFQVDEIHRLIATLGNASKSPHLYHIASVLLKLYSSSDGLFRTDAYADLKKTVTIDQPNAVLYGTGLPDGFWNSLTSDSLENGLIGRFAVFEGCYVAMQSCESVPAPDSVLTIAKAWGRLQAGAGDLASEHPVPIMLRHTADAADRFVAHMRAITSRRLREDSARAALWSRSAERAAKFALLFAASRWAGEDSLPDIELSDVNRGIALSNWMTRRLIAQGTSYVAENAWDATVKRVFRIIRTQGPMTQAAITRRTQWLPSRQRVEALDTLIESGRIVVLDEPTGGRPRRIYSVRDRLKKVG